MSDRSDLIDAGSLVAETWLADQIAEARYQGGIARARDIEAETCNGCQYATKSNWGGNCEAWLECRADLNRKDAADKRAGRQ
jgi:hypothetical protein